MILARAAVVGLWALSFPALAAPPGAPPAGAVAPAAVADLERGQKLFQKGDTAGALAAFEAAVKAAPQEPRAHYLRGVALERKGDLKGAEAAYRQAVTLGPQFAEAR